MGTTGTLDDALNQWQAWMQAAGMSQRTIRSRLGLLGLFARHQSCDPMSARWLDIAAFLARDLSPATRQTYFADIRAFYRFLVLMDLRVDDPTAKLHKPRAPRRVPRPITTDQLSTLLCTVNRRRTRTMILLAAYAGLRAHEIAKTRGEYVRGGTLRVIGKGGVDALVPLHPFIAAEAQYYPRIGYWFPAYTRDGCINANTVSQTVSATMQRAGIPGTCHSLRHWTGTQALKAAGGNLRVAQEILRHASPSTTAAYTLVDDEERRAAVLGLPTALFEVTRPRLRSVPRGLTRQT